MQVSELKGYKSLRAFNVFHKMMLGMKMLPMYMGRTYDEFFAEFSEYSDAEKIKTIKEAALFVELSEDEVHSIISFCTDKHGIPYGPVNVKNLSPTEIIDIIVAVCFEIGKIKIDLLSDAEKKN